VTKEQETELEDALNAAMNAWMEKHGYALPSCIVDVELVRREKEGAE